MSCMPTTTAPSPADEARLPVGNPRPWGRALGLVCVLHVVGLALLPPQTPPPQQVSDPAPLMLVSIDPPRAAPRAAPSQPAPAIVTPAGPPGDSAVTAGAPAPIPEVEVRAPSPEAVVATPRPVMPGTPNMEKVEQVIRPLAPAEQAPDSISPANASYFSQLNGWLNRHKRYPAAAKKAKQQGVVIVNFTIDRRGALLSSRIERSSGQALLDDAALALLQRAAPMPRIPDSMGLQTLTVSLPIDYSLITR